MASLGLHLPVLSYGDGGSDGEAEGGVAPPDPGAVPAASTCHGTHSSGLSWDEADRSLRSLVLSSKR